MKKTLLASTALVGAALLAAPASAGTVGSKDAMSVTLGGTFGSPSLFMTKTFPLAVAAVIASASTSPKSTSVLRTPLTTASNTVLTSN